MSITENTDQPPERQPARTEHDSDRTRQQSERTEQTERQPAAVRALAEELDVAHSLVHLQGDAAILTKVLSPEELAAEADLARRERAFKRQRREAELRAQAEEMEALLGLRGDLRKAWIRDQVDARRALDAGRRSSDPAARLASLHRASVWSARAMTGVVVAGMLWSATNVQHNLAPDAGLADPLFWFSYFIEAMISVCLVVLMVGRPRLAAYGVPMPAAVVLTAEGGLLALTVALNTYPHVPLGDRPGDWGEVMSHSVAPVMIGVALLIHNAMSAGYGMALRKATAEVPEGAGADWQTIGNPGGAATERVTVQAERVDDPETVHMAELTEQPPRGPGGGVRTVQPTAQPTERDRVHGRTDSAQYVAPTEQPTEQPATADRAERGADRADTAAGTGLGDQAIPAGTAAAAATEHRSEHATPATVQAAELGTEHPAATDRAAEVDTAHGTERDAVHAAQPERAPSTEPAETVHGGVRTEQPTAQPEADDRAGEPADRADTEQSAATAPHEVVIDPALRTLAAEVKARVRTRFDVEAVALVLTLHYRDGLSVHQIKRRELLAAHPSVTSRWVALADEIRAEGAQVIELRKSPAPS